MIYIGVAAALTTACTWAVSSVIHADVARRIGVHSLLLLRQPLCVTFLGVCAWFAGELTWYPPYWVMVACLSGIVAIFMHDWFFYESVARVGVRCALVCNSLSAVCTAVLGVVFLGEPLGVTGITGVLVSTAGVILVVTAEHDHTLKAQTVPGSVARRFLLVSSMVASLRNMPREYLVGVGFALTTAVLMAVGMIFSKLALSNGIPPLFMALTRNTVAMTGFFITAFVLHNFRATMGKARATPHLFWMLVAGCLLGPGGGTWMFMIAMQHCSAAVAATLVGLEPVALLVVTGIWERRCPAMGSIVGSLTACAGVALLLWR